MISLGVQVDYFDQFSDPSFHSWNNPKDKMIIKVIIGNVKWREGVMIIRMGKGIMIMISISKIRKITARRKNRRENGNRALDDGLKPHSKGDVNSRSLVEVFKGQESIIKIMGRIIGIIIATMEVVMVSII